MRVDIENLSREELAVLVTRTISLEMMREFARALEEGRVLEFEYRTADGRNGANFTAAPR